MYYAPAVVNPSELAKRIKIAHQGLLKQNMENHNRTEERIPNIRNSSAASTSNKGKAVLTTFTTTLYNYHANPSIRFNQTLDNSMKLETELSLEAAFWISLIFVAFLFSVITFYCILIQKEEKGTYEDEWLEEMDLKYSAHSKAVLYETDDSTTSFKDTSRDAATSKRIGNGDTDEHAVKLKTSLLPNSCGTEDSRMSKTNGETQNKSRCSFKRGVIYTEDEIKKQFSGKSPKSSENCNIFAWQLQTKSDMQFGANSPIMVYGMKYSTLQEKDMGYQSERNSMKSVSQYV